MTPLAALAQLGGALTLLKIIYVVLMGNARACFRIHISLYLHSLPGVCIHFTGDVRSNPWGLCHRCCCAQDNIRKHFKREFSPEPPFSTDQQNDLLVLKSRYIGLEQFVEDYIIDVELIKPKK